MNGEGWWPTVHGVAKSRTRLTSLSLSVLAICSHFANSMPIKKRLTISAQIITRDPCWELQFEKTWRTPLSLSHFSVGFIQILLSLFCSEGYNKGKGTGNVVIA